MHGLVLGWPDARGGSGVGERAAESTLRSQRSLTVWAFIPLLTTVRQSTETSPSVTRAGGDTRLAMDRICPTSTLVSRRYS